MVGIKAVIGKYDVVYHPQFKNPGALVQPLGERVILRGWPQRAARVIVAQGKGGSTAKQRTCEYSLYVGNTCRLIAYAYGLNAYELQCMVEIGHFHDFTVFNLPGLIGLAENLGDYGGTGAGLRILYARVTYE